LWLKCKVVGILVVGDKFRGVKLTCKRFKNGIMVGTMGQNTPPDNKGQTYKKTNVLNLRAQVFKAHYTNPNSDTFMNVLQSALRAGYSQEYSESLGHNNPKWYAEMMQDADVQRARMLKASENALEKAVNYDDNDKDKAVLKLKAASFIAERLGKDKYSMRQEVTGADGRRLFTNETRDGAKMPLATLFKGVSNPQ
jgi:hypothetical protein